MPPLRGFILVMGVVPTADAVGYYHVAPPGLEMQPTLMPKLR
jgi:hypothetical protein